MSFVQDLQTVLRREPFRRLFAVRLGSQFSDGIFGVALGSYVLFSPERQPNAAAIAVGFAVLLLPFSLLGPFCGVFLDRWSRRQLMLYSNLLRVGLLGIIAAVIAVGSDGVTFFCLVLASLSINRFLLASLSAALPHVVPDRELVMANAVAPSCGTLASLVGVAVGTGVQLLVAPLPGRANSGVVLLAAVGYLGAALLALRLGRRQLGPDLELAQPAVRTAVRHVAAGLVDGARHVWSRRAAAHGLAAIAVHRFFYGTATVATILLFRNLFHPGDPRAAMSGMAVVVFASGVGFAAAALLTPLAVARMRKQTWIILLLGLSAVGQLVLGGLFTSASLVGAGFVLGLGAQGIKIAVDTLVQENIDDAYRGRVFSFYDMLFNVVFVAAATFAAIVLPPNGKSYLVLCLAAAAYVLFGLAYRRWSAAYADTDARSKRQPLTATR